MMDHEKILERLAARAGAERVPLIDVSGRVMRTIGLPARVAMPLALWVFSGAATAAAAAVLLIAATIGGHPQAQPDLMADFMQSIGGIIQ
jgi:hypothetical protein